VAKQKNETKKEIVPKEEWEQMKIFSWKEAWVKDFPRLKLLHCTLNGIRMTPGMVKKYKKLGNINGVPDICFPAKSSDGKYPGLYIELKRMGKIDTVREGQHEFMKSVKSEGFAACACEGHYEAIDVLADWLGMSEEDRWSREF